MGGPALHQHRLCGEWRGDPGDYGRLQSALERETDASYVAAWDGSHCGDRRI
jgi:hypothetical protein